MDQGRRGFGLQNHRIKTVLICLLLWSVISIIVKRYLVDNRRICWLWGCFHAAKGIRNNMDNRVEPCEDFYEFACGSFIETRIIPPDEIGVDTTFFVQSDVDADVVKMIEADNELDEPESFKLVKILYKSCTSTTEDQEIEHLKEILKKLGGWPMLDGDSWDDTRFNWRRWMYEARKVGDSGQCFINFASKLNTAGTKHQIILTDPPTENQFWDIGFHSDSKIESIQKYFYFFVVVAEIFGIDQKRATLETEDLFRFIAELVNIIVPPDGYLDEDLSFKGTLLQLKQLHPSVPWSEHFENFLPPNTTVADDEIILIQNQFYYVRLEVLMSATPKRVQANYAIWRVILGKMSHVYGKIRNSFDDMIIKENIEPVPLWKVCFDDVVKSFLYSVNARYVKKYFSKEMKNHATEIFENIMQELVTTLKQNEWMTEATRVSALERALAIKSVIGYNATELDDDMIEEMYRGIQFTEDNYVANMFNHASVFLAAQSKELRGSAKPITSSRMIELLVEVTAEFHRPTLTVRIPAAILRDPYYNIRQPMYLNYGAIGVVMGHELIHAFDDESIRYDMNNQKTPWVDEISRDRFQDRTQCLIDQYADYTGAEAKVFGRDYLGEHISDNGGIKLAYRAYKNWVAKNGEESRIPGFEDYTPRQMFWISYANTYCAKRSKEYLPSPNAYELHAPSRYRVIGTLSNMLEFAEDFECSKKSAMAKNSTPFAMVPEKRCSVW